MTKFLARCRQSGSFIAGLLIGLAIVFATFALTETDSRAWRTVLTVGAPVILALGVALQVLVTAEPRRWLSTAATRRLSATPAVRAGSSLAAASA
jgi:hypothetical protein